MTIKDRARLLRELHDGPAILTLVNAWDVPSARIVAANPATQAVGTASYAIAAVHGYDDDLPADLMLSAVARIVDATDLPVTADLQAGYDDVTDTITRAVSVGVVGANIEDENRPFADAITLMEQVMSAATKAGLDEFVLNARTDAFWHATDRPVADRVADAIARGQAFLDTGASCVFVPGVTDEEIIADLVAGIGERKISVMATPGGLSVQRLEELGVARVSVGPWAMNATYGALAGVTDALTSGGALPANTAAVV